MSSPGDVVGGGRSYRFTSADARFTSDVSSPGSIVVNVQSNDLRSYWSLRMGAPAGQELRVGTYENAEVWTSLARSRPRFTISGGVTCSDSEARFEIRTLTYGGTRTIATGATVLLIERLHVFFAQRCTDTSAPGLTGELSFIATQ